MHACYYLRVCVCADRRGTEIAREAARLASGESAPSCWGAGPGRVSPYLRDATVLHVARDPAMNALFVLTYVVVIVSRVPS